MIRGRSSFSKNERILKAADFRSLFRKGISRHIGGIKIYFLEKSEAEVNRIGISVAKKVVPRATDRNQIKRVIRDYFRNQKNRFIKKGDLLVKIQSISKPINNNELRILLEKVLVQNSVIFK